MRRIGNILRLVCVIGTFLTLLSISNAFKLIDNEEELLPTDLLNSNNGIGEQNYIDFCNFHFMDITKLSNWIEGSEKLQKSRILT